MTNTVTVKLRLDAADFNKQMGKIKKNVGGGAGGSPGAKTKDFGLAVGGAILAVKALEMIGSTLGKILGIDYMIAAAMQSLKPIQMVMTGVGKVLAAMLYPITTIISTLLVPLIWMLMPMVRMINMLLRPFRQALMASLKNKMDAFKSAGTSGQTTITGLQKLYGEAITEALIATFGPTILTVFGEISKSMVQAMGTLFKIPQSVIDEAKAAIDSTISKSITDMQTKASTELTRAMDTTGVNLNLLSSEFGFDLGFSLAEALKSATASGVTEIQRMKDAFIASFSDSQTKGNWKSKVVQMAEKDFAQTPQFGPFNFNVQGDMDEKTAKKVVEIVDRVIASKWRSSVR